MALCILIITPPILGFAIVDSSQGRRLEAMMTFAIAGILLSLLALLPFWSQIWNCFRVALVLAVALVDRQIAIGGSEGYAFLWLYTFPVIVFFLFGTREGLIWVLAAVAAIVVLFFGDFGLHLYPVPVGIRFLITFGIVSALAYGLEASRRQYYEELLTEKTSLESAMQQIETLRGLLPICAACKSVRDDRGYWNDIETYITRHSQAEFRTSLCPDCRDESPIEASPSSGTDAFAAP